MSRHTIVVEFDEDDLGPVWFNESNLGACLYGEEHTRRDLLKIVDYNMGGANGKD